MPLVQSDKLFSIFSTATFKSCSKGNSSLMDPTKIKKIQAKNRYKRRQFQDNLYFYSLTALTCSLFYCVTLCLPYLYSLVKVFFSVFISSLTSVLLTSKFLFIIGNLIIFVLIANSKVLSSNLSSTTDVYYDEYMNSSQIKKPQIPAPEVSKAEKLEQHVVENVDMKKGKDVLDLKCKGCVKEAYTEAWPAKEEDNLDEGAELSLVSSSDDELNKRADDFIARVNRQRRLELSLLQYGGY